MITAYNLKEVINSLNDKEKKRILNSWKEYTVVYLHIFNAGCRATIRLTNDFNRYKNVYKNGNAILPTSEIQELINL